MFKKTNRLTRQDIETVFKNGKNAHTPLFGLSYITQNNTQSNKYSIVVSKKVAKTAVVRNKLRRRGYSILKKESDVLKNNHHIILFFKKGADRLDFKETTTEIKKALKKAGLYA